MLELENQKLDKQTHPPPTTDIPKVAEPSQLPPVYLEDTFEDLRREFYKDPKNLIAQNICSRLDPFDACIVRKQMEQPMHVFQHRLNVDGRPISNQKNSGRCWIFAAFNCMRLPFMKSLNIDDFEFSAAHIFFWDKIERSNFFLHNIIETSRRKEQLTGRLTQFVLADPISDGGQWDMFVNLVLKYGVMPKKCFPETYSSEQSSRLNAILKSKLRGFARELREIIESGNTTEESLKDKLRSQMEIVYRIVGICLGIPNDTFTWEFYDKARNYHKIGPITPLQFYFNYVQKVYDVQNKVCLVNDPRNPYGQCYTIDMLGNVVGGRPVFYNNYSIDSLMRAVTDSIKDAEPVWFGCEVIKRFASKQGIEDLGIHDFKLVFGTDIQLTMSKDDRLSFGESVMTHAMIFTAVSVLDSKVIKFRVENSWGEDRGEKGNFMMTADWFKEFVFEVVVDKKYIPKEVLPAININPIVLPAWDPMGTLAFKN